MKMNLTLFRLFTALLLVSTTANAISVNAQSGNSSETGKPNLQDVNVITEDFYQKYTVNQIAEAIVDKVRVEENNYQGINPEFHKPVNVMDKTQIILFFQDENLNSIKRKGFLNQHIVGDSQGSYDPGERLIAEDNFTGIKMGYGEAAKYLRPKSAFLNVSANVDLAEKIWPVHKQYGEVGAVLNDSVKNRSLWTSGDSKAAGGLGHAEFPVGTDLFSIRGSFFRNTLPSTSSCMFFYEASIYGTLDFSDVAYFLVGEGYDMSRLKMFGKPVYVRVDEFRNRRVIYSKGRLLYKPNAISTKMNLGGAGLGRCETLFSHGI